MDNIFRKALRILDKNGEMTPEEEKLQDAATIPLDLMPQFSNLTTRQGLGALVKMVEEKDK
ncbi:hypothetical protein ES708_30220 [subsurface metagenome]